MNRPFGSIDIGAEMAASMGTDPRSYLTEEQIQEQLRVSGMTRDEWDAEWERRLEKQRKQMSDDDKTYN